MATSPDTLGLSTHDLREVLTYVSAHAGEWKAKPEQEQALAEYLRSQPLYQLSVAAPDAGEQPHTGASLRELLNRLVSQYRSEGKRCKGGKGGERKNVFDLFFKGIGTFQTDFLEAIGWEANMDRAAGSSPERYESINVAAGLEGTEPSVGSGVPANGQLSPKVGAILGSSAANVAKVSHKRTRAMTEVEVPDSSSPSSMLAAPHPKSPSWSPLTEPSNGESPASKRKKPGQVQSPTPEVGRNATVPSPTERFPHQRSDVPSHTTSDGRLSKQAPSKYNAVNAKQQVPDDAVVQMDGGIPNKASEQPRIPKIYEKWQPEQMILDSGGDSIKNAASAMLSDIWTAVELYLAENQIDTKAQ